MAEKFNNQYRIPSARLTGYDYRKEGVYYVTICTKNRIQHFGKIENGNFALNEVGIIAHNFWAEIPQHYNHTSLEAFVIMPNHIHGIICINNKIELERSNVEAYNYTPLHWNTNQYFSQISPKAKSLSTIIRAYKAAVTIQAKKINPDFEWQPRFYDHIIRNSRSLENIKNYIHNNPLNWEEDEFMLG